MNRIVSLLFFLLSYSMSSNSQTPKFVISPYFSFGSYIPNGLSSINGTEQLTPIFTPINSGNFIIDGQEQFVVNSTNKIGVNLARNISRSMGIQLGLSRTNLVKVFNSPSYYSTLDTDYGKWAYSLPYFNFSWGVVKRFFIKEKSSTFISPTFVFSPILLESNTVNDSRKKGNGFVFRTVESQKFDMSLGLEIGQDIHVFNKPLTISANINLPLNTIYSEKVEFYQNKLNTSNSLLKHNSLSFFINLKYRINIFSKDKDLFNEESISKEPKVKKEKEPKVKKEREPKVKKEKEPKVKKEKEPKVKKEKEPKVKKEKGPSKAELAEQARKEAFLEAARKREQASKDAVVVKSKPTIGAPKKVEPKVETPKAEPSKPMPQAVAVKKAEPKPVIAQKPVVETKPVVAAPKPTVRKMVFANKEVKIGEKLVLKNIQFEQSDFELLEEGEKELENVYSFMTQYPGARIEITGHTSAEGDRNDNLNLSRKRAESCKAYLVKRGIEKSRINAFGLGPDQLLSKTQKDLNRRVELRVISLGK
jgi:outer membrane protein OmpA-like peptidoglycan-associated protein